MKRLRTALVGVGGICARYLDALRDDEQFELIAVGDPRTDDEAQHLSAAGIQHHRDYRSLIVETASAGLDLLVVALEPRESFGFVTLAGERGINVFHTAPFALSTAQGRGLVAVFAEHDAKLVVARSWMFSQAFAALGSVESLVGKAFAVTVMVTVGSDRTDGSAGTGFVSRGALLYDAYERIDLLVHLFGTPLSVYAQCAAVGDRALERTCETQDGAMVTLRFADDLIGSVAVLGSRAPATWTITIAGTKGTATLSQDGMEVLPDVARSVQETNPESNRTVERALSAFGGALLSGVETVAAKAEDHLATIATIEAAYLSAKTGAPESPMHLLG